MNTTTRRYAMRFFAMCLLVTGCGELDLCNDLGELADADGNGFVELTPPEGVEFDSDTSVRVLVENTLTIADLVPFVSHTDQDASLANEALFLVQFTFTIEYADGAVQTVCQTEPLGPFTVSFEGACHETADLTVELIAISPLTGMEVTRIPVGLSLEGVDYECGQTVEFRTFVDDAGEVVETLEVS